MRTFTWLCCKPVATWRWHAFTATLPSAFRIVRRLEFTRNYRIDVTYEEHSRILQALLQRDGLQAKVLLQKHIPCQPR